MSELHEDKIIDDDHHFIIDPVSRTIRNSAMDVDDYFERPVLVRGDKNSERFTFEVPLEIEGHNMSECDRIEIHYINIDSDGKNQSADIYEVTDAEVEGDQLIFSWLLHSNATKYVGTLSFAVKFLCFNTDVEPGVEVKPGDVDYAWNTKPLTGGANVDEGYDNKAAIADEYADILQEWYNRFDTRLANKVDKMAFVDSDALSNASKDPNRPFNKDLYDILVARERVYMEKAKADGGGLSTVYYLSANADAVFDPFGYNSLDDLCEKCWMSKDNVTENIHYKIMTTGGKTTYHARLFSTVARTRDGQIRVNATPNSSTDATSKSYVDGGLRGKINVNSISADRDKDCVLIRARNGGVYTGVPVGIYSTGGSVPVFTQNHELVGWASDSSPEGSAIKNDDDEIIGYQNGALINKGYAKLLDAKVLADAKAYANDVILVNAMDYTDGKFTNAINHANGQANSALQNAKAYADAKKTEANNKAAEEAQKARTDAMSYTDDKFAQANSSIQNATTSITNDLNSRLGGADVKAQTNHNKDATTIPLRDTKGEMRCQVSDDLKEDGKTPVYDSTACANKAYVITKASKALTDAKSYTDKQIGDLEIPDASYLMSYADEKANTAFSEAVVEAQREIDSRIIDLRPFALEELPEWLANGSDVEHIRQDPPIISFSNLTDVPYWITQVDASGGFDGRVNELIDHKLGDIENGTY